MNMDLSLIICTRDRCEQLARCLHSLRALAFERPWELIVVDNGSTDGTSAVVKEFIDNSGLKAVYLFEPNRGKSTALNTALRTAQGRILAFTDDDCYPAPDFLARVWSAFADAALGYISGRILLHDPADYPIAINDSTTALTFAARSFIYAGAVGGGNMAFRREVLVQIGGFDPSFGPGAPFNAAEDVEVAARASAIGWKGEYRPEVIVSHHHGRKESDAARMWKAYGIGAGAYHMKLLLHAREFSWFLRSVYQVRRRIKLNVTWVLWEPVGAAKYAYLYVTGRCANE